MIALSVARGSVGPTQSGGGSTRCSTPPASHWPKLLFSSIAMCDLLLVVVMEDRPTLECMVLPTYRCCVVCVDEVLSTRRMLSCHIRTAAWIASSCLSRCLVRRLLALGRLGHHPWG